MISRAAAVDEELGGGASETAKGSEEEIKLRKMQFTVDEKTVQDLEEIRRAHRDPSLAQSFRRAAAVTAFVERMRKDGYEVLMKKGDEVFKIFIP